MNSWKSCENCSSECKGFASPCPWWNPIPCRYCGGALSETREHNGKKYRHCFACHFEFFEEGED